jgi:hypothetical protein
VQLVTNLQEAVGLLRAQECVAIILDQGLLDADPDQAELVMQHTGTAIVVPVNCAICGTERIVREVRAALRRREREEVAAREAVERTLLTELHEPLTALLLECELLRTTPDLPPQVQNKIEDLDALAHLMAQRLQMSEMARR